MALLDPFDGGGGSKEDFLGLEAAGACVDDYPLQLALLGFVGSARGMKHFGRVRHIE